MFYTLILSKYCLSVERTKGVTETWLTNDQCDHLPWPVLNQPSRDNFSPLSSQQQQQPLLKYMDKGRLCQLWMILSVVLLFFGVYCLHTRLLFRMKLKWKEENKTIDYPGKTTNTLTNSYRLHELHTWKERYFLLQIMIFQRNTCQIKGWTRLAIAIRLFWPFNLP